MCVCVCVCSCVRACVRVCALMCGQAGCPVVAGAAGGVLDGGGMCY